MCDLYLYVIASPKSSKGIPEAMSFSPLLGLPLKYFILTWQELWHFCGYSFISVSKEQKGFVQVPIENYIFMKIWLVANCVLLFFTLELYLRMRSSSDSISVIVHVIMHSAAVSRGDELYLAWTKAFAQDQEQEGEWSGNAMANTLRNS